MSIHHKKAIWFSNQFLGTSKEERGEGIVGFWVSSPGDFEDSSFLDLMKEKVNFLLGAMDVLLKAWKGKDYSKKMDKIRNFGVK